MHAPGIATTPCACPDTVDVSAAADGAIVRNAPVRPAGYKPYTRARTRRAVYSTRSSSAVVDCSRRARVALL